MKLFGQDMGPDRPRWIALVFGSGLAEDEAARGPGYCDAAYIWEPNAFDGEDLPRSKCEVRSDLVVIWLAVRTWDWEPTYQCCAGHLGEARSGIAHEIDLCVYAVWPEACNEAVHIGVMPS